MSTKCLRILSHVSYFGNRLMFESSGVGWGRGFSEAELTWQPLSPSPRREGTRERRN